MQPCVFTAFSLIFSELTILLLIEPKEYNMVQESTVHYSTVSTVQHGTVQYNTAQCTTAQYSVPLCPGASVPLCPCGAVSPTIQYCIVQCSTVQLIELLTIQNCAVHYSQYNTAL